MDGCPELELIKEVDKVTVYTPGNGSLDSDAECCLHYPYKNMPFERNQERSPVLTRQTPSPDGNIIKSS